MPDPARPPSFTRWQLLEHGPYRLFFPLGLLAGLWGVGHWMLWSVGWVQDASRPLHVALQVNGFLTCFVIGFIMTAIPRFVGAMPATRWDVGIAFLLEALVLALALGGRSAQAQIPYVALLLWTLLFVARRLPHRTKAPPSSFLLIGFGFVHAIAGSVLYGAGLFQARDRWTTTGQEMLETGFLLCLVLGIAGYLLPFLTGYAGDPSCDPEQSPLRRTHPRTLALHGGTGLAILLSFWFPASSAAGGAYLRAMAATLHFLTFGQLYRPVRKNAAHAWLFWIACWMIPIGLWATAVWPDLHIGMEHIVFIGGYSLLIFSFGTLVVVSHSAQAALLQGRLMVLKVVGALVLLATLARVTADGDAWRYKFWIHIASGLWWAAALIWLIYILPKVWRIPPVDIEP